MAESETLPLFVDEVDLNDELVDLLLVLGVAVAQVEFGGGEGGWGVL